MDIKKLAHEFNSENAKKWDTNTSIKVLRELVKNGDRKNYSLLYMNLFSDKHGIKCGIAAHKGNTDRENEGLPQFGGPEFCTMYKKMFEKYWKHSTCFIILCGKSPVSERLPRDLFRMLQTFLPEFSNLPEEKYYIDMINGHMFEEMD
jgi:hypothetical protein